MVSTSCFRDRLVADENVLLRQDFDGRAQGLDHLLQGNVLVGQIVLFLFDLVRNTFRYLSSTLMMIDDSIGYY